MTTPSNLNTILDALRTIEAHPAKLFALSATDRRNITRMRQTVEKRIKQNQDYVTALSAELLAQARTGKK